VDDVKELYSLDSLREDIYKFWGYRIDFKESEAKEPKKVYERLLTEIAQSLTEQRERLLDLVDGILGAIVEETCPTSKPPEDWDWKGIKSGYIEHFASKPPEVEHLHDPEQIAAAIYKVAEESMSAKEKEMGTLRDEQGSLIGMRDDECWVGESHRGYILRWIDLLPSQ